MVDGSAHPYASPSLTLWSEISLCVVFPEDHVPGCPAAFLWHPTCSSVCLASTRMQSFNFYHCWNLFAFGYLVHSKTGYFKFPLCTVTTVTYSLGGLSEGLVSGADHCKTQGVQECWVLQTAGRRTPISKELEAFLWYKLEWYHSSK